MTYHNASPDALEYLWVQLDQNYFSKRADSRTAPNTKRGVDLKKFSYTALDRLLAYESYDGELKITKLTDAEGRGLPHAIVKTITAVGAPHDCLEIHYAGGDKLFLPVENIELLSRYGSEASDAQLDKLGGGAWQAPTSTPPARPGPPRLWSIRADGAGSPAAGAGCAARRRARAAPAAAAAPGARARHRAVFPCPRLQRR